MKTLDRESLARSKAYIVANCSPLARELFAHSFEGENQAGVVKALSAYQNPDGGFGHNLEGDFMLPDSSPMATSVAFQILSGIQPGINARPQARPQARLREEMVRKGITYLLGSYQPARKGWITVPKEVNGYPHASWWHYVEVDGGSAIDRNWGNPTAELVGYLVEYRSLVPAEFLDPLYQHTLSYLREHADTMEMHELACFLRLAERMPKGDFQAIRDKLTTLVVNTVETNPEAWKGYSAQPLFFVRSPDSFLYAPLQEAVQANLDFLIESMQPDGTWAPPWRWESYEAEWQIARVEIIGRMTVENLKILDRFGRLEQG